MRRTGGDRGGRSAQAQAWGRASGRASGSASRGRGGGRGAGRGGSRGGSRGQGSARGRGHDGPKSRRGRARDGKPKSSADRRRLKSPGAEHNTVFVSSLPPPTNGKFYSDGETAALRKHFEKHGALAMDPIFIGKSRSGYATFAKPVSAQRAVLDKRELHGSRPKVVRSTTAQRPKKTHVASAPHVHAAAKPARPADGGWQGGHFADANNGGGDDADYDEGGSGDYYDDSGGADAGVGAAAPAGTGRFTGFGALSQRAAPAATAAAFPAAAFPAARGWERKQPAPRPPAPPSAAPRAAEAGLWVRKVAHAADAPAREAQLKARLKAKLLQAKVSASRLPLHAMQVLISQFEPPRLTSFATASLLLQSC